MTDRYDAGESFAERSVRVFGAVDIIEVGIPQKKCTEERDLAP